MKRIQVPAVFNKYIIPASVILIMGFLIGLSAINFVYEQQRTDFKVITCDLAQLSNIFQRINNDCTILSFDAQKNPINFLNVEKFVGSEVGPMNLAYPENWKGPYVQDNPTIQGYEYLVVSTNQGLYITPGEGVELPNGKIIGQDLQLTPGADLEAAAMDPEQFSYRSSPLVLPIKINP